MKQFIRVKNWHGYAAVVLINVIGCAKLGPVWGWVSKIDDMSCYVCPFRTTNLGPRWPMGPKFGILWFVSHGGWGRVSHGLGKQTKKHEWAWQNSENGRKVFKIRKYNISQGQAPTRIRGDRGRVRITQTKDGRYGGKAIPFREKLSGVLYTGVPWITSSQRHASRGSLQGIFVWKEKRKTREFEVKGREKKSIRDLGERVLAILVLSI